MDDWDVMAETTFSTHQASGLGFSGALTDPDGDAFHVVAVSDNKFILTAARPPKGDGNAALAAGDGTTVTVDVPPGTDVAKINWGGIWKAVKTVGGKLKGVIGGGGGKGWQGWREPR